MKIQTQYKKLVKFSFKILFFYLKKKNTQKKERKNDGIRPQKGQVIVATLLILDVSRLAVIYNCYFLTVDMLQT